MSGRAPSLSPKKERATSRRNGPLERPDHKRLRAHVSVKVEPEDEKPLVKVEELEEHELELVFPKQEVADTLNSGEDAKPVLSQQELEDQMARQRAVEYLKHVGASQNVPNGFNIIDDKGLIHNPTQIVQKYEYYAEHTAKEPYFACTGRVDPTGTKNHYCKFYRDGYRGQPHVFKYLNLDGSVFYENEDGSQYYIDDRTRWFKPSPRSNF